MKSSFYLLTLLIAFVFSVLACHKDTISSNTSASEYFPNSVGDYWEYTVFDSSLVREHLEFPNEYNVKVSIIGKKVLLDSTQASMWLYQYPWGNDTNYVTMVSDTIKVYDTFRIESIHGLSFPLMIYILPFSAGKRWDGNLLITDSFHIYNEPHVNTLVKTFTDCFNIYHYYFGPNMQYMDNYWFKPNIGMIKIYLNDYNFSPRNKYLWQLKKYSLH